MAKHGNTKSLKRLNATARIAIAKKKNVWLIKPGVGPHKASDSIALAVLLREVLGIATRAKEAIKLCKEGRIKVDGRVVKNPKFPIGFMDVIQLSDNNTTYYMDLDSHGRLVPKREDRNYKLLKITGKRTIKGGRTQLALSDGRTIISDNKYNVGDSLKVSIPDNKILGHIPLKEGSKCIILAGKNAGVHCTLQSITPGSVEARAKAFVKTDSGEDIMTVLHYLYAIG
ncbi:MAG: S4 domain-containing protein [Candidatus Micrarchaeia archaeon]